MKVALCNFNVKADREYIEFFEKLSYIKKLDVYTDIEVFLDSLKENRMYDAAFLLTANEEIFLLKPVRMEQLKGSQEKFNGERRSTEEKLIIRHKGKILLIPMEDILYLESQLHKVNIVLEGKTYQCNECLEELSKRLNPRFLKCHKSYLVNVNHILEFCSREIVMDTGQRIPVSKNRYADAKRWIYEYLDKEFE